MKCLKCDREMNFAEHSKTFWECTICWVFYLNEDGDNGAGWKFGGPDKPVSEEEFKRKLKLRAFE